MKITSKQLAEALQVNESTIRQWKGRSKLIFDKNKLIDIKNPSNHDFITDRCMKNDIDYSVFASIKPEPKKDKKKPVVKKSTPVKVLPKPEVKKETPKKTTLKPKEVEKKQETKTEEIDFDEPPVKSTGVPETLSQKKIRTEITKNKLEIEKKKLELDKVKGNLIDIGSSNDILNRAITGLMSNVRDSVKQTIQSKLSDVDPDRIMDLFKTIESEMNSALTETIEGMINDSDLIVKELSQTVGRGQAKMATK